MTAPSIVARLALPGLLALAAARGQEWPRFRGPNGSGVLEAAGLPAAIGPHENVRWKVAVPFSRSSPVLGPDAVYLTASDGDGLLLLSLARADGELRWRRRLTRARRAALHELNDAATPTPAVDETSVYAFFPELGVVCFDHDGTHRWTCALGPFDNEYGMASSPILAGDLLLLLCDQAAGSYLLALDKKNGEPRWKRPRPGMTGSWTTPVLHPSTATPEQVITFGMFVAHGYDVAKGAPLWFAAGLGWPVSSPVLHRDLLLLCARNPPEIALPSFANITAAYDANRDGRLDAEEFQNPLFSDHFSRVDTDGNGFVDATEWQAAAQTMVRDDHGLVAFDVTSSARGKQTERWRVKRAVATVATPLVYGDTVFMVRAGGILSTLDPKTGEVFRRHRLPDGSSEFYASPVAGDGKVYVGSHAGKFYVLSAKREWKVLHAADFDEPIDATPAIGGDGALYVRTAGALYCFASGG